MSFDLHLALGYCSMLYGDEVEEIKPWYRGEPEAGHRRLGGSGGWRVDLEAVSTYCGIQIFTLLYRVKPPWKFTSGRRKYSSTISLYDRMFSKLASFELSPLDDNRPWQSFAAVIITCYTL
jgi:hypothetical protein